MIGFWKALLGPLKSENLKKLMQTISSIFGTNDEFIVSLSMNEIKFLNVPFLNQSIDVILIMHDK
jgi:hypothetical protein